MNNQHTASKLRKQSIRQNDDGEDDCNFEMSTIKKPKDKPNANLAR